MNKIIAIFWKDILVRFTDKMEWLFFLILPLIFTAILGGSNTSGPQTISLLVVNEDASPLARQVLDVLARSGRYDLQLVSAEEAQKKFNDQAAPAWVTIPAGFEAAVMSGQQASVHLRKLPQNNNADAAERALQAAVSEVGRPITAALTSVSEAERKQAFASPQERQDYFERSLEAARALMVSATERVNATQPAVAAKTYDQGTQASTGQLVTWVFIPLVGTSALLAYERRQKTLQRLVTTATSKATFLLGAVASQLGIALVQMLLLVAFGVYVMKINWGASPAGLAVMLITFGLASTALGVALGTFLKTEKQANNLSIMIGMVFALLGGCWFPLELFPKGMQAAAQVLPTYWAITGFNNLAMRGLGLESVILPAVVLVGFAAVFFVVGVARFRYE